MSDKDLGKVPMWLQSGVKAVYMTGFTVILALVFYLFYYFVINQNNTESMFGCYIIAQIIVSSAFFHGIIEIKEVKW